MALAGVDVLIIDFNDIALDCPSLELTVSIMIIMNCASVAFEIVTNSPNHPFYRLLASHSIHCLSGRGASTGHSVLYFASTSERIVSVVSC